MITQRDAANIFYNHYSRYKELSLNSKRIKHSDIVNLINRINGSNKFDVSVAGRSVRGREIFLIKTGSGKNKIFLWSQMHGDESTATLAIFDIINFLNSHDEFDTFRNNLLEKNTIFFLPMVNPDGAEYFQRRNEVEIDLNRDALQLESPEAKILFNICSSIKPDFGFNLHDQSERYSVGNSGKQASISFLAPPIDEVKTVTSNREKAMLLIAGLTYSMQDIIPGHIAKYSDEYEPRAFGDNFQKSGMSTVLVESGGWKGDAQKQFLRNVNFVLLLTAFESITSGDYKNFSVSDYELIPENGKMIMDLILRNVALKTPSGKFKIDIGVNREELTINDEVFYKSTIEDIGDLSVYYGLEDFDMNGFEIEPGRISDRPFTAKEEIINKNFEEYYLNGITDLIISDGLINTQFTGLPLNFVRSISETRNVVNILKPGMSADFILLKNGAVQYVVVNGFLYNIQTRTGKILNGTVKLL